MEANFWHIKVVENSLSLGICPPLLGLSISAVAPMAVVGADEVQQSGEPQLEQIADSSVEEERWFSTTYEQRFEWGKSGKIYTIDLAQWPWKGPNNKGTEQSHAGASTEGKSVKERDVISIP